MKSALFSLFKENLRPVWRFWQLWRSKMRFGQNVLGMTWKERFVQFSWKAHTFLFLKRIWGQCDDFDNFNTKKCNSVKTCCAWPEKSVLYNFHKKRTVFTTSRELEASMTILTTLTLKNAIWPKRATHGLKTAFCKIFMKGALFCRFGENLRPVWRLWQLWRSKRRFCQNVLRITLKEAFVQFSWKAPSSLFLERVWGQHDDFDNFDAHKCDLAKTCYAWPGKSVLYNFHEKRTVFSFGENLRPVWRFWQRSHWKMRFGQNVLRMTWKERFVQFSWKLHCFPVLKRILGQCDDFKNFDAQKWDLAKTCSAWPEKSVLYNFHGKRTILKFWPEFQASVTNLRNLMLKNAICPKRAAHDLKRAFCAIFMKSALFSLFGENLKPVWRFWQP